MQQFRFLLNKAQGFKRDGKVDLERVNFYHGPSKQLRKSKRERENILF
jgi:hypothetical protein